MDFINEFEKHSSAEDLQFLQEEKEEIATEDIRTEAKKESVFKPSESEFSGNDFDALPVDDIFDFAEKSFNELSESKNSDTNNGPKKKVSKPLESVMSSDMIEMSAAMYVEILESVIEVACEWFSGVSGDYRFKKVLKDKYIKISEMYISSQNISLTPTHFFILMTVILVGSSGFKAYKDKSKRITAEKFRKKSEIFNSKKSEGSQGELFTHSKIESNRTNFEAEINNGIAYFTKGIDNAYAKKSEREEVPPEISAFIFDYKGKTGKWPKKEHIKAYLNFN